MVEELAVRTGRPAYLMLHGVHIGCFSPARRKCMDQTFRIGYVGRLTPEKNVRAFVELEQRLLAAGRTGFRFVMIGEGSEREWLGRNLNSCEFTGVLRDQALATAFAGMDVFVFPSCTDTFGLVMLEAMASGVPVVANREAGNRAGVQHGITGLLGEDLAESILQLMDNCPLRQSMSAATCAVAATKGWCQVFAELYRTYNLALTREEVRRRMTPPVL